MNYPKKTVWSIAVVLLVLLALVPMRASAENNKLDALQAEMDAILVKYLGTTELTNDEVIDKVSAMTWDEMEAALADRDALAPLVAELSSEDLAQLEANYANTDTIVCFYETIELARTPALYAATGTHTPVTGVTVGVSGATDNSMTDGAVTVTAKGSAGILGFGASAKTATITITNDSGATATVAFDWAATSVNELNIDGTKYTGNGGSFSKLMDAGTSFTITITTAKNDTVNKLVMSNFSVTAAAATSKVTILFDSTLGSVTAAGSAATSGAEYDVTLTDGIALTATPKSNVTFLGWINESTHEKVDFSGTYYPAGDITLRAVFASATTDAWFLTNGLYYNDLNQATAKAAASTTDNTVVLAANGTLPALTDNLDTADINEGVYTIPSGVTLLIPYDDANTVCTENPTTHDNAYTNPTVYRTLTMASGANITVNGAISVSGKVSSKYSYNGMPSGPLGFINMQSGSNITVNSGANLYVWGYIKGSGSVTVNSGGTVHECFQIADYRGGDVTSTMTSSSNVTSYGVFPFNQYYLQNVEVPMTLHAGAMENGFGAVTVNMAGTQKMSIPFIGASGSMFVIDSGYIVKDYIEGTGRTEIKAYGNITITPVSIEMKVSLIGSITIDTNNYALPIPNHMTISLESGSINMNQSMAFLPGSELYIREDTTCTLGSDKNIYVYDWDNWIYNDGANGYAGTTNKPYVNISYVPGGNGTTGRSKDALVQIDGTVDVSAGSAYVTADGANIYSTGTGVVTVGSATKTEVYQVITDGTEITSWPAIEIQPAILLNADGTEVATTEAGTYTYYASTGRWDKPSHFYDEEEPVVTAPTCVDTGYTTHTCAVCGHSYQDTPTDATGIHTYGEGVYTTAANTADDYNLLTCEVCAQTMQESLGLPKIYATNVRAGDGLDIFFYVKKTDVENLSNLTAKITRTRCGVADAPLDIPFAQWTEYGTDYLRFSYSGIAAKEMTDEVYIKIYSGNTQVFAVHEESVEDYALRALGNEKSELNTALVDMLNYGAAAQESFDYNKTDLANQQLTPEQQAFATQSVSYTSDGMVVPGNLAAASVSARNKLVLTFYYSMDLSENGYTAHVTYTDHYGNPQTRTISTFRTNTLGEATVYGVDVTGLAVADGRQLITCVIKDGNGEEISKSVCSVENYIAKTITQATENGTTPDPVYELLMKFVDSAYAYFH